MLHSAKSDIDEDEGDIVYKACIAVDIPHKSLPRLARMGKDRGVVGSCDSNQNHFV